MPIRDRTLEVVFDTARAPVDNMALDEAALAERNAPAQLRLYGWRPAAISLGYFQRAEDMREIAGGLPMVRRTTGGGAILHDREITFALTCDESVLASSLDERYARLHAAIARALGEFGVPTLLCGRGAPAPRPNELWCFGRAACHDLVTAGDKRKIVGSAQRRALGRVLHHGSIILTPPSLGPTCGAVADFVDPAPIAELLRERVAAEIARGLEFEAIERNPQTLPTPPSELCQSICERLSRR